MKIWWLFYTLWQGRQENKRRKKFSLLKCIQKWNVIKKIPVVVFSFMYLVLVDAMNWSIVSIFFKPHPLMTEKSFKIQQCFPNSSYRSSSYKAGAIMQRGSSCSICKCNAICKQGPLCKHILPAINATSLSLLRLDAGFEL